MRISKICFLSLFLIVGIFTIQAQTADNINPNAEADIATVQGFLENLVKGKAEAAKMAAHENMKNFGPGVTDSVTVDKMTANWVKNQEAWTDIKINWVGAASILALEGPFKGTHVYLWGNWSGTNKATGKTATNMFQYTAILHDGKITAALAIMSGAEVHGYDISSSMNNLARALYPKDSHPQLSFHQLGQNDELPNNESFDLVTSFCVFFRTLSR